MKQNHSTKNALISVYNVNKPENFTFNGEFNAYTSVWINTTIHFLSHTHN